MRLAVKSTIAVLALSAATGIAFAAWAENGTRMLASLAQTGLSWCF